MSRMELLNLCELIVDCPHSTAQDEGEGFPLIRTPNIGKGRLLLDGVHRVSKQVYDDRNKRAIPQEDDLIFAREATPGNVAIIKKEKVCLGQRTVLIRPNKLVIDSSFLMYYMLSPKIQHDLLKTANGSTVNHVNMSQIRKLKIKSLPKLEMQKQISHILEAYDLKIENNNKRIKILEQMAEELYKEWFVRCRFPEYKDYKFKHEKPKGWVLGTHNDMKIPQDWSFGKVENIGNFSRGKNITKEQMIEGNVPVISAGIEPSGYHNASNVKGMSLTMSASGANAGYLKYNLEDIWAADCSYYQDDSNIWFMYHSLNFIRKAIDNLQVGSAQPHVYPKNINKLCIMVPEEKYIKKFNELVSPVYLEIKRLQEKNKNLEKQRDLLLPRLMFGKLEVK